jgi:hypothetical protein
MPRVQLYVVRLRVKPGLGKPPWSFLAGIEDLTLEPQWSSDRLDAKVWPRGEAGALREFVRPFVDMGFVDRIEVVPSCQ